MSEFNKSIIKGTLWSVLGQMSSILIILITNIWLARLLTPQEFGQVGVIMFFIIVAGVFTEGGLGGSLVRKKDATKLDYSTVFVSNIILSFFCFIVIYLSAGYIANYYDDPLIEDLLIVASLVLIINALQIIQNASLVSKMKFKQLSLYRFIAVLISSVVGIYFAYQGLGVWTLVLIQLLTSAINTLLLWSFEGFFMSLYFSKTSFKELFPFGMNTTLASIINTGFDNVYQLVLAKYFSLAQTGYFYQAKKLQDVPGGIVNMVMQSVVFSSLAKLQDDKVLFKITYDKITLYFLVILGFITTFIYVFAEPIILVFYGEKWIGAIFYLQILTIASYFYLQESVNRVIFKVFNKTHQILYLEYVKKFIQIISIVIGVYYLDYKLLIIGFVITNIFGFALNYYYARKIIGFRDNKELLSFLKVTLISLSTLLSTMAIINISNLSKIEIFLISPFLILVYAFSINFFKVLDIKEEFKKIRSLLR